MTRRAPLLLLLVVVPLLVGSCSSGAGRAEADGDGIVVERATIDLPLNPAVAAVRMDIRNERSEADALVGVESAQATSVVIHRSDRDSEGRSTMRPTTLVPVPAGSTVQFAPGGLHIMLSGITDELQVGDKVALTLTFEQAGTIAVNATVVEPGTSNSDDAGADGGS